MKPFLPRNLFWPAWLFLSLLLRIPASAQVSITSDNPAAYVGRNIGPHSRTWARVTSVTNRINGAILLKTNSYLEVQTGLGVQDPVTGTWRESSPDFLILPNGYAVATNCQHQLLISPTLDDPEGFLDVSLPNGAGRMRILVLGLKLFDAASGRDVQVSAVKPGAAGLQTGPAEITFIDAFNGLRASLRIRNERGGYHQDILLLEKPTPQQLAAIGFEDLSKVRLEAWSEFVSAPTPSIQPITIEDESTAGATMVEPELGDYSIDFGVMRMQRGLAFIESQQPQGSARVFKQWLDNENRHCLIEAVKLPELLSLMTHLPDSQTMGAKGKSSKKLVAGRVLPPKPATSAKREQERRPIRLATLRESAPTPSVLLDYTIVNGTLTNLTCHPDETIFISGQVTVAQTLTLMGGGVLKFTNTSSAAISASNIVTRTGPYRMVALTSKNDNSLGQTINGSTGSPTNYNGGTYLQLSAPGNTNALKYLRFAYAGTGISSPPLSNGVWHCQFINCATGISCSSAGTLRLHNVLFSGCNAAIAGSGNTIAAEHLTVDGGAFNSSASDSLLITNSIFTDVTSQGTLSFVNCGTNSSGVGVFQNLGAANYYLVSGSTNRGVGTTLIDSGLLADLRKKTTTPPEVCAIKTIYTDVSFSTQVPRITAQPDLGFAYDPIDYALCAFYVSNATVTVTPGIVIGTYATNAFTYGLGIAGGVNISCEGNPQFPVRWVEFNTVQEQPVSNWKAPTFASVTDDFQGDPGTISFRFTDWACMAQDIPHLTLFNTAPFQFRDTQFHGGTMWLWSTAALIMTNCALDYVNADLEPWGSDLSYFCNNLVLAGTFYFAPGGSGCLLRDNLFDRPTIADNMTPYGFTYNGYNAYVSGYDRLHPTNSSDIILASSPAYETGPLGSFYLPTNSPLVDAGSVSDAGLVGMYHYTTRADQAKELNSALDLSYHYVAVPPLSQGTGAGAAFVGTDTTTQGTWKGIYGAEGYNVINNSSLYPSYAQVSPSGQASFTWNSSTTDTRALQKAAASDRIAACWYSATQFTVSLNLSDTQFHRVAFYCLDWDTTARAQTIEIRDAASSALLDSRSVSNFNGGKQLVWDMRGNLTAKFTLTGSYNAVLSGLFFATPDQFFIDTDGDGYPDYIEDVNGNGNGADDPTSWTTYNSPNGLSSGSGLQVFTPLK